MVGPPESLRGRTAGDEPPGSFGMEPSRRQGWRCCGLFFTGFVALASEVLHTRLLSLITWWCHVSFFAVSTAGLGMAAGAVRVHLHFVEADSLTVCRRLPGHAAEFALSTALSRAVVLWLKRSATWFHSCSAASSRSSRARAMQGARAAGIRPTDWG